MVRWKGFEKEGGSFDFTSFTASEVTSIAGIPQALLRAWRSRGLLSGGGGKSASFTSLDVAEILIRYQLSLNGIPPGDSFKIGREAAKVTLFFALLNSDGACEIRGSLGDVATFMEKFEADHGVAHEIAGEPEYKGFLWRGDGSGLSLVGDVAQAIDEKRFMANFFIDLQIVGLHFVEEAGRPLVSVEAGQQAEGKRIRRLSRGSPLNHVEQPDPREFPA